MSASRSHSMQLCQPKLFFTLIPKFIVSAIWQGFFNRCLALSPRERSWYLEVGQWRSDGMQSPMGTQEKGILMPGVDSCIVKDQKCPIIAEFGKKNLRKLLTEDNLWEPALSLWTSPLITYMTIASNLPLWLLSLAFLGSCQPCANLESVEFWCSFNLVRLM